jgi:undecaprenyl-diphosphatase
MTSFDAVVYGVIQGISEFLPVSSSGHLALLPKFMKLNDPGVLFDLMMHLGTALAVIIYFKNDVSKLLKSLFDICKNKKNCEKDENFFYLVNFVIATFSSVIVILLIKDLAFSIGRSSFLIGLNLIVFGIILFLSDLKNKHSHDYMYSKVQLRESIFIGVMQSLAIFPGVSRSGITITGGRMLGLSRRHASSFSFLMSVPIIFAGIIKSIPEYIKITQNDVSLSVMLIGVIVSFIIGILSIHFFIKLISKVGLWVFTLYRVAIGLIVLFLI